MVISLFEAYFVGDFCYHSNGKIKIIAEIYTSVILLINQSKGIDEKLFLGFGSRGGQRTSDSLNEGLSIKMTREKFQRNQYFFYEKDSRFNPRLIHKNRFLIGQVAIEKYGLKTLFLLFNI